MNNILYTILSLINLIKINLICFLIRKNKKKIIFFYHPKPKLTSIHKYYIEDMFMEFSDRYKIIYGHQLNNLRENNYYFLKERYLKFLFFIDYFVSNNICDNFSTKSKKIYIHHNIYDDPWVSKENEKEMCNRLNKYDYILMSSDFSIERIKQTFKNHKIDLKTTFVETGYAKLDYLIKNKTKIDKDSILIAPTGIKGFPDLTMKPFIEKIIKNLLHSTKFKVILRPHPSDRENVFFQEIRKKFEKKTNFEYDISDNYLNVYLKSKIMITDLSGTAYTFAFLNLSPVIFFSSSDKKEKELEYSNYDFFRDRNKIGKILNKTENICFTITEISKNYPIYVEKIRILRNNIKYLSQSYEKYKKFFENI